MPQRTNFLVQHVVFGEVQQGAETVKRMEGVETGPNDKPVLTDKVRKLLSLSCSTTNKNPLWWRVISPHTFKRMHAQVVITDCGVYTGGRDAKEAKDEKKKKKSKSMCIRRGVGCRVCRGMDAII